MFNVLSVSIPLLSGALTFTIDLFCFLLALKKKVGHDNVTYFFHY